MMDKMINRENEIFSVLQKLTEKELDFVLVGGYAVSAFSHRFSVDADIVIDESNLDEFTAFLEQRGFKETTRKDLDSVYSGRFISYKKDKELPVTVDLLVNSLQCRQTGASWSYEYLKKNSKEAVVEGSEKSVDVILPERELLVAIKLHSARATDIRDAVALSEDLDMDKIRKHIERGDEDKLIQSLKKASEEINREGFRDSFRGVFTETDIPKESIKSLQGFLQKEIDSYEI